MERRISKVYQVLATPRLIAGVEYALFMSNVAITFLFCMVLHFWWWLLGAFLIHKLLQVSAKNDPLTRPIFITYSHHADHYEPWPSTLNARSPRPRNFGRGDLW